MTDTTDNTPEAEPKGATDPKPSSTARPVKSNLVKVIPTDRVVFEKQASALRAYAAASGREKKAVTNDEVAAVMSELAASSISLCNPFFSDVGLLIQEGRKLRPVDAVFDLQHAHQWNPETAGLKLGPIFSEHWAAKVLVPKLAFRALSKEEAIAFLAEESKATTAHRKNLETLLDFLNFAGVIRVEGNAIQLANNQAPVSDKDKNNDPPPPPANNLPQSDVHRLELPIPGKPSVVVLIPKSLDEEDWKMFQTMFSLYVARWKGFTSPAKPTVSATEQTQEPLA